MKEVKKEKLIKDRRVVDEINRHKWLESEKRGLDISFDKASVDWFNRFADAWIDHYMPNSKLSSSKDTHQQS